VLDGAARRADGADLIFSSHNVGAFEACSTTPVHDRIVYSSKPIYRRVVTRYDAAHEVETVEHSGLAVVRGLRSRSRRAYSRGTAGHHQWHARYRA
jgi:hypothetical protein